MLLTMSTFVCLLEVPITTFGRSSRAAGTASWTPASWASSPCADARQPCSRAAAWWDSCARRCPTGSGFTHTHTHTYNSAHHRSRDSGPTPDLTQFAPYVSQQPSLKDALDVPVRIHDAGQFAAGARHSNLVPHRALEIDGGQATSEKMGVAGKPSAPTRPRPINRARCRRELALQ